MVLTWDLEARALLLFGSRAFPFHRIWKAQSVAAFKIKLKALACCCIQLLNIYSWLCGTCGGPAEGRAQHPWPRSHRAVFPWSLSSSIWVYTPVQWRLQLFVNEQRKTSIYLSILVLIAVAINIENLPILCNPRYCGYSVVVPAHEEQEQKFSGGEGSRSFHTGKWLQESAAFSREGNWGTAWNWLIPLVVGFGTNRIPHCLCICVMDWETGSSHLTS